MSSDVPGPSRPNLQGQLQLFQKHYSDIIHAVSDHCLFGAELFSKGLLSPLEWKNARSSTQRTFTDTMCTMLDDVYSNLSTGAVSFNDFLEVLMKEPQTAHVAQAIRDSLRKLYYKCSM